MPLRRSTVSRFLSVLFAVLIVLPFTAPFQTLDLGAPTSNSSCDQVSCGYKVAKDLATVIVTPRVEALCDGVIADARTLTVVPERRRILPTVLRL